MKSISRLLLGLAATQVMAADPLPAWAGRLPEAGTIRVAVPPPAGTRFDHLSWPKVVRTPKGTVILACAAGIFHGDNGGGSPAVAISRDGGFSFSEPKILHEFGPGEEYTQCGNLALGMADDGAVVLLAMAYTGNVRNNIYGWRSTDEGATWNPVDTANLGPNKTGSVFGSLLATKDLGMVVVGHFRKGAKPLDKGIWWANSRDAGRSWSAPRVITDFEGYEPVMVEAGNRLLVFIRNGAERDGPQYVAVSDDRARTWKTERSQIKPVDSKTHALASPFAIADPNHPGELLILTTERGRGANPARIVLWRGSAARMDWKMDRVVLEFPRLPGDKHIDLGYPWLLHLEGHRWLMYYYHGVGHGPNAIWSAELEL